MSLRIVSLVLTISLLPPAKLSLQAGDKDEDPELLLIQAQIGLRAAVMNRVSELIEAEIKGEDRRTALEKAREKLLIAQYNSSNLKVVVTARTANMVRQAKILEARNKGGTTRTGPEKVRNEKLAASKEVAKYKAASERLLRLVKQREKALRQEAESGKNSRSELEKAAAKVNKALAESPDYQAATKRLKAVRQQRVIIDLELLDSISLSLRAALLRIELAGKK